MGRGTCAAFLLLLFLGSAVAQGGEASENIVEEGSAPVAKNGEAKAGKPASVKTKLKKMMDKVLKKKKASKKCSTVSEVLSEADNLSIVAKALKAAGLVDTVNSAEKGLTIFAPTDDAFEAALEDLGMMFGELKKDKALLEEILLLHVLPKPYSAKALKKGGTFLNLLGEEGCKVQTEGTDDGVAVSTGESLGTVVKADIMACSTVIHVIDTVLLSCEDYADDIVIEAEESPVSAPVVLSNDQAPVVEQAEPSEGDGEDLEDGDDKEASAPQEIEVQKATQSDKVATDKKEVTQTQEPAKEQIPDVINDTKNEVKCQTVVETLEGMEDTSEIISAVKAAGLVDALQAEGASQTLFVPSDSAFGGLLETLGISKEALYEDKELLSEILSYHVLPQAYNVTELHWAKTSPTILEESSCGTPADLRFFPYAFKFFKIMGEGGAGKISKSFDVPTCSGFVHMIDDVLLPCKVFGEEPTEGEVLTRKLGKVFYG
ncbi:hypothetical protein BSKO_12210 [Bryopsis sp. KO-2023]|nr:hypothetical protein BSKO_12210 [Bryopsis sp. KO-2023]